MVKQYKYLYIKFQKNLQLTSGERKFHEGF